MATDRIPTLIKIQELELKKLLAEKLLRNWTTADVILWLQLVNDGLFAKYTPAFESQQIDGKALMNLDEARTATQFLGTQHHSLVFVQSIKQLKMKNGRKMGNHRRRLSRRLKAQSLASLPLDNAHLFDTPPRPTHPRSSTPTGIKIKSRHASSATFHFQSPPISPITLQNVSKTPRTYSSAHRLHTPRTPDTANLQKRSHSHDDVEQKEPTDKKALWRQYRDKDLYSAILFKRGKFNTSFKKRWLVLCERKRNNASVRSTKENRPVSSSVVSTPPVTSRVFHYNAVDANALRRGLNVENKQRSKRYVGYLFYFNQRPIKDSDFPNGFVDLSSVECVVGLLDDDDSIGNSANSNENKGNNHKHVKYLRNKAKNSEYYEIVLKTKDREWVFGAIDTSSYVEWLIRLKKYEK